MTNLKKCCCMGEIDFNKLSERFFSQFDPKNQYKDCELFNGMKKDLSKLCNDMRECKCESSCSCDDMVEKFFENYKSLDKYLTCHLASDMKDEMKKMCSNFEEYYKELMKKEE